MRERDARKLVFQNSDKQYSEVLKGKGLTHINQYSTPKLRYPSDEELMDLTIIDYAWQRGDRFYKIAANVYNDMTLWWVIPWFNKKPLEADYEFGEIIHIPMPIDTVLSMI